MWSIYFFSLWLIGNEQLCGDLVSCFWWKHFNWSGFIFRTAEFSCTVAEKKIKTLLCSSWRCLPYKTLSRVQYFITHMQNTPLVCICLWYALFTLHIKKQPIYEWHGSLQLDLIAGLSKLLAVLLEVSLLCSPVSPHFSGDVVAFFHLVSPFNMCLPHNKRRHQSLMFFGYL